MSANGRATESTTRTLRTTVMALLPPALRSARGDREGVVRALVAVSGEDALAEAARVALAGPRHRDHEGDRDHPGQHPDPSGHHETHAAQDLLPAGQVCRLLVGRGLHEAGEDEDADDGLIPRLQRRSVTVRRQRVGAHRVQLRREPPRRSCGRRAGRGSRRPRSDLPGRGRRALPPAGGSGSPAARKRCRPERGRSRTVFRRSRRRFARCRQCGGARCRQAPPQAYPALQSVRSAPTTAHGLRACRPSRS